MFLEARYVGETLGEDNIMEVLFEDLKKDVLVELVRYTRNHVVEASRIKVPFNVWTVKVLKGHTRSIRNSYFVKGVDRFYRLGVAIRERNQAL